MKKKLKEGREGEGKGGKKEKEEKKRKRKKGLPILFFSLGKLQ